MKVPDRRPAPTIRGSFSLKADTFTWFCPECDSSPNVGDDCCGYTQEGYKIGKQPTPKKMGGRMKTLEKLTKDAGDKVKSLEEITLKTVQEVCRRTYGANYSAHDVKRLYDWAIEEVKDENT